MAALVYGEDCATLDSKPAVAKRLAGVGTAIVTPFSGEKGERLWENPKAP